MTKFMDKLYKNYVWVIITLSLVAYFTYRIMSFQGTLENALQDHNTWINLLFVVWINVNMVSGAYDSGTNNGLRSEEFDLADKLNNKIIISCNNEMKNFREYIKLLNKHELVTIQEDYLFKVGDKKLEDLTENERKEYDKLRPVRHNIYGFNLPLYYDITKNGEVTYRASVKKNEGKRKKQFKKIFTGILFGAMTVNMAFSVTNFSSAFTSLLIIMAGLSITFVMVYFPQMFKFRYEIPKKVILKNTLWDGFVEYKNGTHTLNKFIADKPKEEEPPKEQHIQEGLD